MLTVVDYDRGNLFSMAQALRSLHVPHRFGRTPADIEQASAILLPGVGAIGDAMHTLRDRGLVAPLCAAAMDGRPLVGICLGMQLLASVGTEFGEHAGLDLIPGSVDRLPAGHGRIPNVGWRAVTGAGATRWVYFVHSYVFTPRDPEVVTATATFGDVTFPAIVRRGNVTGLQFHPEKSGRDGLGLLAQALDVASFDRMHHVS